MYLDGNQARAREVLDGDNVQVSFRDKGSQIRVSPPQSSRVHRLNLEQRGPELAGHQRSTHFEGPVSGWLNGDQIQLSFTSRYEGSTICYFFDGQIRDGNMTGTAMLGAASDQNHGIVNRSQFGPGKWQASRIG